ncbi:MAG: LemA family protein [Betaproteobacteria bacterium]|nr:LemA family protein [Betaproteobacteria bacterium]
MTSAGVVLVVLLAIALAVVIWGVMRYNGLVAVKNDVQRAWSNIDVLLKQRHDEIPKLVETCRQYKQFEQETLVKVAEARSRVGAAREARDVAALGPAEAALRTSLAGLFAVVERYPDLKANQQFMQLQTRISGLENTIADRREYYNDVVNVNNIMVEQFPDAFIARMFNFKEAQLLHFDAAETADVDMRKLFAA